MLHSDSVVKRQMRSKGGDTRDLFCVVWVNAQDFYIYNTVQKKICCYSNNLDQEKVKLYSLSAIC